MADVSINASCGCGYKTGRLEEAKGHSDRTKHKMTILGAVTPTGEEGQVASTSTESTIAKLRAKLNGGN